MMLAVDDKHTLVSPVEIRVENSRSPSIRLYLGTATASSFEEDEKFSFVASELPPPAGAVT